MKWYVKNVVLSFQEDEKQLKNKLAEKVQLPIEKIRDWNIVKKAIDARKNRILFVYTLMVDVDVPLTPSKDITLMKEIPPMEFSSWKMASRPVVIGFGPAGMMAGYALARSGMKPIIIERGKKVEERSRDFEQFRQTGVFFSSSNACFGEGGAGTFSDGKLHTGISSDYIQFCLETLVRFGAPKEILYQARAHIGTDILKDIMKNIREEILRLGGEVLFETTWVDMKMKQGKIISIEVEHHQKRRTIMCDDVIMAIGHSARDTYEMLQKNEIVMKPKDFSLGVRIEHLQKDLDFVQYGKLAGNPKLPASEYHLSVHLPSSRGVYSFCMCPGGEVIASNSEKGEIVTNGMSYSSRSGKNCNAAILVSTFVKDFDQGNVLDGMYLQKEIEQKAFCKEKPYFAPVQRVEDFLHHRPSTHFGRIKPTYLPGTYFANLWDILPSFVAESLEEAIPMLAKKCAIFSQGDAIMTGVETRSSSPVSIPRNEQGFSSIEGLYPCGEGASYAGGILSAMVDGLRVEDFMKKRYQK